MVLKLSKNNKADLSVNVIIIAAIALIVLVVLIIVFTGRFGIFSSGVEKTSGCEKACKALGYGHGQNELTGCTKSQKPLPGFTSEKGDPCCCAPKTDQYGMV